MKAAKAQFNCPLHNCSLDKRALCCCLLAKNQYTYLHLDSFVNLLQKKSIVLWKVTHNRINIHTVVATMTFTGVKPSISTSNVALKANPGTVLKSIYSSWGFQNSPNMFKLIEFWLRYLRSKTNDMILKKAKQQLHKNPVPNWN